MIGGGAEAVEMGGSLGGEVFGLLAGTFEAEDGDHGGLALGCVLAGGFAEVGQLPLRVL